MVSKENMYEELCSTMPSEEDEPCALEAPGDGGEAVAGPLTSIVASALLNKVIAYVKEQGCENKDTILAAVNEFVRTKIQNKFLAGALISGAQIVADQLCPTEWQ
jgi:hypothetical protein